ncbi:hypothetical protein AC579_3094 [Pseudocercospora musae]|uniref:Uncharacterized protein n=1 Tax=Pseudocercospora musae TaxID=113226 RepID=A0A139I991_9PEZI|nr:hypothetical protein AC579_307 [Pseudocercospora musae]KXT11976.1 hypothetical protein AC579_3094 [Pseudocercospora musae]
MIRTHRPRGYAWNCASDFQNTELFRHIKVEDYADGSDALLCSDSDDAWPRSERAAKKRRIAALADNFLDGFDLELTSAIRDPHSFRHAFRYSFATPKDAERALAEVENETTADAHDDSPDLWEVLKAHNEHGEPIAHQSTILDDNAVSPLFAELHAQSSCRRRRSRRLVKIALHPSEHALRRAAELVEETQCGPTAAASTEQDMTSFSDCGPSPTPAWTSSKWLRTGAFQPPKKRVDEDCSKDELGLSSFSMASQQARTRAGTRRNIGRDAGSQPSFVTHASGQPSTETRSSFTSMHRGTGPDAGHPHLSAIAEGDTGPTESGGHFETAPEEAEDNAVPVLVARENQLQGESQTQLFIREGILAKPRTSWASVNVPNVVQEARCTPEQPLAPIEPEAVRSAIRESTQSSGQGKAGKRTNSRSTKSAGNTPTAVEIQPRRRSNRRRTAPSESQKAAEEIDELPAEQRRGARVQRFEYSESAGGKNSSPFVFRKRATRSAKGAVTEQAAILPPSEHTHLPSVTPRRAMQFPSEDSQAAKQDPHTPLVNEHLNTMLPKEPSNGRRSTLRSSLRNEMRALGAEISRAADDPSSQSKPGSQRRELPPVEFENEENVPSQQYDAQAHEGQGDESTSHAQRIHFAEAPLVLPGTQAMLDQAHHDLFTSPDKTNSELYLGDKSTPGALPNVGKSARRPLGALSQERMPMPSTQALINEWHGWSSVKKPREPGKRSSLEAFQSPTVTKGKARDSAKIASDPVESVGQDVRRRSSLRFSMSFAESPAKELATKQSSQPARSTALVPETCDKHRRLSFTAPKPSGKIASSATFSCAGELSSISLPSASAAPAQSFTASTKSQSSVRHGIDSLSFGPHELTASNSISPNDGSSDIALTDDGVMPKQHIESSKFVMHDRQASRHDQGTDEDDHDLSFTAPLAQIPRLAVPIQDDTVLDPYATTVDDFDAPTPSHVRDNAPTPSYIRNNAPTPSQIGQQNSSLAPNARTLEYDSQDLAGAVNELTRDILGNVSELTF